MDADGGAAAGGAAGGAGSDGAPAGTDYCQWLVQPALPGGVQVGVMAGYSTVRLVQVGCIRHSHCTVTRSRCSITH